VADGIGYEETFAFFVAKEGIAGEQVFYLRP
jgi:hypothetical protein